eukprot:2247884-Pyramimonas_sp.AAC.1
MNDPEKGQVIIRAGNRDVQVQCGDARHSLYIEALIAREIGPDNTELRTVLTCVASLPAGRPALTFGYVPTMKGTLQMTTASRASPKVPPVTYADSCSLIHYDNDVSPGFHYHDAEGIGSNIHDTTGSAHSRSSQCLEPTKPQAGFDQDLSTFEDLADAPMPEGTTREASEAEPAHDDGRLSTIYEE